MECYISVRKNEKPSKALTNNLYTGITPQCLKELTCVEEALIARCRVKCCIYNIDGHTYGKESQLKMKGIINLS